MKIIKEYVKEHKSWQNPHPVTYQST